MYSQAPHSANVTDRSGRGSRLMPPLVLRAGAMAWCLLFLALDSSHAKIFHRWSFTETTGAVVDSIGTANGTVVLLGTNSTRANGTITLNGGNRATSDYVQLPAGLVHSLTNVTIELWAGPNAGQTWSRLFDFGPGNDTQAGTFFLSLCRGTTSLNQQRFEYNSPATWTVDTALATTAGAQYQYVVTWSATGATNGGGLAQWYRNGVLIGSANTGAVNITNVNDTVLWLGRSQFTTDNTASATYNELRIFNHAMSQTEINIDMTNGPDTLILPPPQASALTVSPGGSAGTLALTWTPGPGSAGSLVVMRTNQFAIGEPIYGNTYSANAAYGSGQNLGNSNYVVYSGSGSSVTISNLIPGVLYYATVYSYSAGGATYNLQAPPTGSQLAPGTVQSVSLQVSTPIQYGATSQATVTADYGQGVLANVTPYSSFSSSAPDVINVSSPGLLQAIGFGSSLITAAYQDHQDTQTVTVINPLANNLMHRYSFTTDASDSIGTANGVLQGNAMINSGVVALDGVNSYVALPANIVTNYSAITMEAWVTDNGSASWARIWDFGSGTTAYMFLALPAGGGNLRGAYTTTGNGNEQILQWPGTGRPAAGQEAHIVWTTDGATRLGFLYVNGVPVATNAAMTLTPASLAATPNDWLGRSQFGGDPYFNGSIDEFRIYNIAISPSLVQLNFQNGPDGLQLPPNPRLPVASPSNVVFAGTTVSLTASVSGLPPYQYQWESNSVAIPGATNSTLVLTNTTVAFSGNYDVVVANSYGTNRSPVLALTVQPSAPPVFTQQPTPAAATGYVGGFVKFSSVVSGSPPLGLQWVHNGTNIPAATASTLTLATLQLGAAGTYTLVASNAFGVSNSAPALLTVLPLPDYARPVMLTYHNDNTRQGANTNEVLLTLSSVNTDSFGKLFSYVVDGYVYTQPLIMTNLNIPGQGVHNVVVIATEHDTVYAFDADSNAGANGGLLWKTNLGSSALSASAPFGYRYTGGGYTDILPEVGATGTPVIDPGTGTMYVNAFTHEGANFIHRIHALDVTTGNERPYSPVVVNGSVPGKGFGSVGGMMSFSAVQHNQRPALTLASGILYVGYAGYADTDPYHGWLFGFNATNLVLLTNYIFNTTPNASTNAFGAHAAEGGIWQGGGGLCVDARSNIYFMTGNGSFSQNTNGGDYSDSFLKLSTANNQFAVVDYFTPFNQANLASADTDLGSGGPILLPDSMGSVAHPHLLVGCGKQGTIYLLDCDTNMGHFQAGSDNQIVQSVNGANNGVWSPPAYFNHLIFYQASGGPMNSFGITNGVLGTSPASQAAVSFGSYNGGPVISANGNNDAIAWVMNSAAFNSSGPGVLYAFNATNLAQQLFNSGQNPARDNPGGAVKMTTPTVAGGKVYVGAQYTLSVYGLQVFVDTPTISPAGGVFTNSVIVTMSDTSQGASIYYTLDGTTPTAASSLYSGPFVLTSNAVVQAIAIQSGAVSSAVNGVSFVNTAALGRGTGLLGLYYANTFPTDAFTGSPLVRTDAMVNFNWSSASPDPGIPPTNYTVRWTGSVQPQFTETYTFYVTTDDGVRLYVNGQLLIDSWVDQNAATKSNTIALAAQQLYNLRMDYYQHTNNAVAMLSWSSPSAPLGIIPQTQLYPYTNPPPSVVLLSPTNNSHYTASASVTLSADADAPYNPVSNVDFYLTNSTTFLGSVSSLPYTITVTGLAAGSYAVIAVAVDGSGLSSTSAPVNITVGSGSGQPYGLTSNGTVPAFFNLPTTFSGSLPLLLSQTGVFSNTPAMTPNNGLIPYQPNTPLWSDAALKTRYLAVPNNGGVITPDAQIAFAPTGTWTFPAGTVFVKTFELNTDLTNPSVRHRLETRLLVRDFNAQVYGVTYKWRPDNSEADLLTTSLSENILITNATGLSTQTWYYPSPADCLTCHTPVANYVLGLNTRQLNGNQTYPATGVTDNQIRTLNRLGLLNPAIDEAAIASYQKLSPLTNAAASLEERARSYLDANCAQCHQPGGTGITFDARYNTPLANQNITNFPASFSLGYDNACIVKSKDVWRSVLYDRMNMVDSSNAPAKIQMPPLARNLIDTNAIAVMAAWINSLPGTPALAPPIITPNGGNFIASVNVTVQPPDTNATIYYTLDGSLPTTNSLRYSGPINLFSSATISANAFETGYNNSVAASALFLVQPVYFTSERFSNNVFQLGFYGAAGSNYVLQATTNFINWTPLSTNMATSNQFNFSDVKATNFPYRFYRVLQQ